jgi:Xaa-Pro dipeptidase
MLNLDRARKAIREEGLSAWLFYNVFHRDEIADLVLGMNPRKKNTRPWVCIVSLDRPTQKIVHRIEASILDDVPGDTTSYHTREEFRQALLRALPRSGRVGADWSAGIPVGSFLDHGTALLLLSLGADLAPSDGLVPRYLGALDDTGRTSHEEAAAVLYDAVESAWHGIRSAFAARRPLTEGEVSGWIAEKLEKAGLESDGPPVVGAGVHTADPHFGPEGKGDLIRPGDVVQFDVWARGREPGSVYADISWVGVCAAEPTAAQAAMFEAVREARDAAVALLEERLSAGRPVSGADADRAARAVLIAHGFEQDIKHRTGHSIGGNVHGFGVNLDSVEFPDERPLGEGACFSVEPGVYRGAFGMRTEIDCIIHEGRLVVTGKERQRGLLTLGDTNVRRR